jgi:hypothetical protein
LGGIGGRERGRRWGSGDSAGARAIEARFRSGREKNGIFGERASESRAGGRVELDSVWTRTRRRERRAEAKVLHGSQKRPWEICKLRYGSRADNPRENIVKGETRDAPGGTRLLDSRRSTSSHLASSRAVEATQATWCVNVGLAKCASGARGSFSWDVL